MVSLRSPGPDILSITNISKIPGRNYTSVSQRTLLNFSLRLPRRDACATDCLQLGMREGPGVSTGRDAYATGPCPP